MKLPLLLLALLSVSAVNSQTHETDNVILVTLDGFRWQELFLGADSRILGSKKFIKDTVLIDRFVKHRNREALLPFFWNTIANEGQLYGNRTLNSFADCSNPYWFSYPGYHEMLVGAVDRKICSNRKSINPNSTVLDFINTLPGFQNSVSAFSTWDVFPYILRESINNIPVNSGVEAVAGDSLSWNEVRLNELQIKSQNRSDSVTFHLAFEHLKRNRPHLLYIALDETDAHAHRGHYDQYLLAAHKADQWLAELWKWTQTQPDYKDKTTLLISTDHGRGGGHRNNWRNHGRLTLKSDQIWITALGPDTPAIGEMKGTQVYQKQLAKTLAAFLGANYQNKFPVGGVIHTMLQPARIIAGAKNSADPDFEEKNKIH